MPPLAGRASFFQRKKHPRFVRPKSAAEELANRATHAAGALLALLALVVLVLRAEATGELLRVVSYAAFGVSLVLLYWASYAYHSARTEERRRVLKIADHAAIYVLIAGSYTPFMANVLGGQAGVNLLVVVWALAVLGVVFKFFFAHRFKLASTLVYLVMGWLVLFVGQAALQPCHLACFCARRKCMPRVRSLECDPLNVVSTAVALPGSMF